MEVQAEPLDPQDMASQPIWLQKFTIWKSMKTSCPAGAGPGGIYCLWVGKNCAYEQCPRRIFEEVGIDLSKVPKPKPPVKLKKQIQQQAQQIQAQQKRIAELEKAVKAMKKAT